MKLAYGFTLTIPLYGKSSPMNAKYQGAESVTVAGPRTGSVSSRPPLTRKRSCVGSTYPARAITVQALDLVAGPSAAVLHSVAGAWAGMPPVATVPLSTHQPAVRADG